MEQETFFFPFKNPHFHHVCLLPITPGGCYERHGNFAMRYFREKTKKCFTEQETIMSVKEICNRFGFDMLFKCTSIQWLEIFSSLKSYYAGALN